MTKMVECEIDSVRVSLTNHDRVVVLKDKNSERYLPIWIGLFESEALTIALQGVQTARPLTHDLLLNAIQSLGAQFVRVEIIAIEEDVYFAQLVLVQDGKQVNVDCRPSDALILLVKARVPIFISEEILAKAAIQPEERQPYDLSTVSLEDEDPNEGLSVFSDFLSSLDSDSPKSEDKPQPSEPQEGEAADTSEDTTPASKQQPDEEATEENTNSDDEDDDDDLDISDILFPKINDN